MKQIILGTGLSGLVGARIVELLSPQFDFADLSLDTGVDITNKEQVDEKVRSGRASWILHLAAKTEVDGCEQDRPLGKAGAAWKVNVEGTRNIVEAAGTSNKRVLYVSTDFVFDGTKDTYTEEDTPNPINWYGATKYEGEKIVLTDPKNVVVRITYPYRAKNPTKRDFVHVIIDRLQAGEPVTALTDHYFTPAFIDDIAQGIKTLIVNNAAGIYHMVGGNSLTPYEAAVSVADVFGFTGSTISGTTVDEYFKNRAPRPLALKTKNVKITALGVKMRTFAEGIREIKRQGVE